MRSYEEAFAAAKDGPPFSNGTEGYAWLDNWCDQCKHDRGARQGRDEGCPLVLVSLMHRTPVEWIDQTANGHRLGDTYHCTEFAPDDEGGGDRDPEPDPLPPCEGQVDMFEVFADQIVEQVESAVTV